MLHKQNIKNRTVKFIHLGIKDYKEAWDFQEKLFQEVVNKKKLNRKALSHQQQITNHTLIFCYHPHVYTLGKSGKVDNMLLNETRLKQKGADFYKINRGGDITYHGPGQIVGYPILDLDHFFTDIHRYIRYLEEAVIRTLAEYEIIASRYKGWTGVWIQPENAEKARKICAIGVRSSRWVTMHGFAFNVNTDLSFFDYIVPCGIKDKSVTSMQQELGKKINIHEVEQILKKHLQEIFEMILIEE